VRKELAVTLYARRLLPLGKARQRAGLSCRDLEALLSNRQVPQDYTEADLKANFDCAFGDEPALE